MDDSRMMGHMFDRNVSSNKHESASVFPLPLNLIALIISYVRYRLPEMHITLLTISIA